MANKIVQYNPALTTSYRLEIPGLEAFNYHVQSVEVPTINMMGIRTDFRNHQVNLPNNKIEYDPFNVQFIVDEDYQNYIQLQIWMMEIAQNPMALRDLGQTVKHNQSITQVMKDISIHLLTSVKTSGKLIKLYNAFPTMLSGFSLNSSTTDPTPVVCTATFMYQYFDIVDGEK